jgi:flagellar hook assembly protein FlgD
MKHYGLLIILAFFSSSIYASNCTPKVSENRVTVEYFDGNGNLVRSESHKVRSKGKYKGLVSNDKAFKKLEKDETGNIKIRSSKLDVLSGGMTTKVSKRDGTSLARIGGCPVSKLKFYKKIGKEKSPFVHESILEAVSKN